MCSCILKSTRNNKYTKLKKNITLEDYDSFHSFYLQKITIHETNTHIVYRNKDEFKQVLDANDVAAQE